MISKTFCSPLTLITLGFMAFASPASAENDALAVHNHLRSKHHAPALTWDAKLAAYAAHHAAQCHFKHSRGPYGENLATGFPDTATAIEAWYDEYRDYSYQRAQFSMSTGHFTQMVWQSTTKLGCASYPCNGKSGTPGNFLVCEYSPRGNIMNRGFFTANVRPRVN